MPGSVSQSYKGPPDHAPYVPSWCYKDNAPPMCSCGHHHGYHNDAGACLHAVRFSKCGCRGYDGETPQETFKRMMNERRDDR